MAYVISRTARYGSDQSQLVAAVNDVASAILNWRLWVSLGWLDIKQRYRRAVVGPFWITLSMCILVFSMGIVYAGIFRQDVATFLPFIAAGFTVWFIFSVTLVESSSAFVTAEGLIKHGGIPLTLHILRTVFRNLIVGLHNMVVMVFLYVWQPNLFSWHLILVVPGLILLAFNLLWMGIVLAVICTRFRDLPPIVASVLQILMFVSPIMYRATLLPPHLQFIVELNPIYYFVEIVRAPLLGMLPPIHAYYFMVASAIFGWMFTIWFLRRFRSRVAYWM